MARKSDQKIKYLFKDFNQESSIFYNQIAVNSESDQSLAKSIDPIEIEQAIDFHNKMIGENILILHKGDFSEDSLQPVLKIFEDNLMAGNHKSKILKRLYLVLVELLQNISLHGYGITESKPGIFSVSEYNNINIISTGNYIKNSDIESLEAHLNVLNTKNKDELHQEYMNRMQTENKNSRKTPGMGLIKVARMMDYKMEFDFSQKTDGLSFFSISIKLNN